MESGPSIIDVVQRPENLFKGHAATARGDEVPTTTPVAKAQVGGEDTVTAVQIAYRFLDMHMVNAIGKFIDKFDRIHQLPVEMAGIIVDAKGFTVSIASKALFVVQKS